MRPRLKNSARMVICSNNGYFSRSEMYKIVSILSIVLLCALPVKAQDGQWESKEQLVGKLMKVMHVHFLFEEGIKTMTNGVLRGFLEFDCITSGELVVLKERLQEIYVFDDFRERFGQAYIETFTYSELEDIFNFYITPTGQKLLRKSPEIQYRVFEISSDIQKEKFEKVQENILELTEANLTEDGECK